MHVLKSNLLARASLGALAVAAAFGAAPAQAQTQTLAGGGATFVELLIRDIFACYTQFGTALPGSVCKPNARVNATTAFTYASVGSGAGLRGWASQEQSRFQTPTASVSYPATLGRVAFALSETALTTGSSTATLDTYNNGGRASGTGPLDIATQADACVTQATFNPAPGSGADFVPLTFAPTAGCFDNPRVEAGPAIQLPFAGAAITVAFDPVYKRVRNADGTISNFSYQFTDRGDGSGGIRLSRAAFCGIFSGTITRWTDAAITGPNGGPVWPDPADPTAPADTRGRNITVTVRDDDSGTTALFTRALRAQCPATYTSTVLPNGFSQSFPGNPTPNSIPATPTGNLAFNSTCDVNQGNTRFAGLWVYARGNEGVAFCLNSRNPAAAAGSVAINGRIGYVSQSFALPTVVTAPFAGYALQTADVANQLGEFVAPTPASATIGLGAFPIPAGAARANPLNWVASPSGADPVANPVSDPNVSGSYPIVGTSNLLLYTCYRTPAIAGALANASSTTVPGFLNWFYAPQLNDANGAAAGGAGIPAGILTNIQAAVSNVINRQGFVRLPSALGVAIAETFAPAASTLGVANPANDPTGLNLYIRPVAGAATPAPGCTVGAG